MASPVVSNQVLCFFYFSSSLGLRLILKAVGGIPCFVANFGENYPRGLREAKMSDAVELGARPPGSFHIAGCSNCPLLSALCWWTLPTSFLHPQFAA